MFDDVQGMSTPGPSRDFFSTSTPPSSSRSSISGYEIENPFDKDLDKRLRHSAFSPSFGGGGPLETNVGLFS